MRCCCQKISELRKETALKNRANGLTRLRRARGRLIRLGRTRGIAGRGSDD